jgi:ribosomal protein S18 acetylase RimI-like enzyme
MDLAGILSVQAIVPLRDVVSVMRLVRAGYGHLADLEYLVSLRADFPSERPRGPLSFLAGWRGDEERLKVLIESTYVHTVDCSRLGRPRPLSDVLEGYRGTGVCRPEWWVVAQHRGEDVGCVLLADHPEHEQCELMYLGVTPPHRGKGWGMQLVRYAQWLAYQGQRVQIVLAVDDANWPARHLYHAARFEVWDRRSVYVRMANARGLEGPSCGDTCG